ncbi:MAG: MSP porin [Treponema sp.]|uniref:major outer sheath protein Msp n=1 Tax=Treponema sp. TaxID=166 RepID=UPI0036069623
MKKYLLVSLTILFAAAFVWAADAATAEPSVDIEADATLSWGIDLGSKAEPRLKHGFKNEASWSVKFPLLKKADKTSTKNDVPVYGEVTLTDVGLNLISEKDSGGRFALDGKVGGLEAKFVIYGAYITAFDSPDFYTNYAEIWTPVDKNKKYRPQDYRFKPGFDGYGTKIGYANKDLMDLDVGLKFGSSSSYDPNDASETYQKKYFDGNTALGNKEYIMVTEKGKIIQEVSKEEYDNAAPADQVPPGLTAAPYYIYKIGEFSVWKSGKDIRFPDAGWYSFKKASDADSDKYQYSIGFDLSIKPLDKMLALALAVNTTFGGSYADKDDANLNFGAEVTSEPVDGLKLKAGFDGGYYFNRTVDKFDWDTVFTAQYKWIGAGVYAASAGTSVGGYISKTNTRGSTDMAVFAQFATKGDKNDATNLVEGLDAGAYVGMYRLLNTARSRFPVFAKVWGSYKVSINDSMWIKPFAHVWFDTNPFPEAKKTSAQPYAIAYDIGVTYSPVEKVEVEAKWSHGEIRKNKYASVITKSVTGGEHYGQFVLSLTVAY